MYKIKNLLQTLLMLLVFSYSTLSAFSPTDLLKPQEAFRISADGSNADNIKVKWRIAEGYYLYESKFRFTTKTPGLTLESPVLPPAKIKDDQFFGKIGIYRDEVIISIPVIRTEETPDIIILNATSQGCADIGVCFPPQHQKILVAMSAAADKPTELNVDLIEDLGTVGTDTADDNNEQADSEETSVGSDEAQDPLSALTDFNDDMDLGFGEEDEILSPEQAYQVSETIDENGNLIVNWKIAEGTYLYYDKIAFELEENSPLTLAPVDLPKPKIKQNTVRPDGSIGDVPIYQGKIATPVTFFNNAKSAGQSTLTIKYQGCAERGICYPPMQKKVSVSYPAAGQGEVALNLAGGDAKTNDSKQEAQTPVATISADQQPLTEESKIAETIKNSSSLAVIGIFFLIGLGLAFTPCVFPMIPILSGIITGQGENITTRKATYLSTVYVLAMALTYTVAGVFAAMSGENLQILLQIPWVIATFAGVFVLLALSMFGFYELQLPSSLQSKLTEFSNKQSGGNTIGVAIMGLLSALIVGPCVAPPLAGALLYIGQTNDPVLGGLALFAMSMGMGVPLILIGASAGKLLPRAGAWMDTVKAVFGVSMLGLAIYFLERILSETVILSLWATLFIVSGVYMGATRQLLIEASGWQKLWKGLGIVILAYGLLMLVGVASGSKDIRQPLKGIGLGSGSGNTQTADTRHFKRITTMAQLDAELATAKSAGKPAVLDFYADWCVYCKTLENEIFPAPAAQKALADAVLIQADVTDAGSDEAKAIMKRFGVIAPPVIVYWDRQGNELKQHKIVGDVTLDDFVVKTNLALQ